MNKRTALAILILLVFAMTWTPSMATRYYVDCNVGGTVHNGSSWAKAFTSINAALAVATKIGDELWVKAGFYQEPPLALNTLLLLYGGFLGFETKQEDRIPGAFPSVIDVGRQGSVITIASGQYCTVDGFTLRNGLAMYGGGVYCIGGATNKITIKNCRIVDCEATVAGGGVYFGTYTDTGTSNTMTVVENNTAPNGAGVVIDYHSSAIIDHWLIVRNHATWTDGGLYCPFHCDGTMSYCTLAYNTADVTSGAAYINSGGNVNFNNCIIAFNSAPTQAGLGGAGPDKSSLTYNYCDLYGNNGGDYGGNILPPSTYTGNYSSDPLFLMPDYDEFHLFATSTATDGGCYPVQSPYKIDRIGIAKRVPVGTAVRLAGKIVSLVDGATTYVQEYDRATAIPVLGLTSAAPGLVLKDLVGTTGVNADGVSILNATSVVGQTGFTYTFRPLGTRISSLSMLTGMSAKVWGVVQGSTADGFTITDGSATLSVVSATVVSPGDFVVVTGVYTLGKRFVATSVVKV
jgi:hypothetical protein